MEGLKWRERRSGDLTCSTFLSLSFRSSFLPSLGLCGPDRYDSAGGARERPERFVPQFVLERLVQTAWWTSIIGGGREGRVGRE